MLSSVTDWDIIMVREKGGRQTWRRFVTVVENFKVVFARLSSMDREDASVCND